MFCHICSRTGKIKDCGNVDLAFIDQGFHNCKDASGDKGCFNSQEQSKCHKTAVEVIISLPKTTRDVGKMLSSEHAKEKRDNTEHFFENI